MIAVSPPAFERRVPFPIALGLVLVLALAFIVLFLYVALSRIRYPFDLEWLEGSMVVHVQRVLEGKSLYVEPSLDFTCYQQQPMYYWISALAGIPLGAGYFSARLVSVLSTLGTFVLLFLLVRRETKSSVFGLIAAGTYAAAYGPVGDWFDIARVDSLMVFWVVAGLYAVRSARPSVWTSVLTALLFLLAFFTKHPAAFVFAGAAAYLFLLNWRQGILTGVVFAAGAGVAILLLDRATQGWYTFYIFELLRDISHGETNYLGFWKANLLVTAPVWPLVALGFLCGELLGWRDRRRLFFPLVLCSAFAESWIARLQPGSVLNVDMPVYAVMAMTLPVALQASAQRLLKSPDRRIRVLASVVAVAVAAQFAALLYNPTPKIPAKADEAAGWKLIDYLRAVPGDVFIPCNDYYAALAGKKTYAHAMSTTDILSGTDESLKKKIHDELFDALRQKKFAAVILPVNDFGFSAAALKFNYHEIPFHLFDNDTVFQPVIRNVACRPSRVFVPAPSKTGLGLLRDIH
jgi:4-amino-4-deoxy-L-arabinose transferase-like glycosyltransferase